MSPKDTESARATLREVIEVLAAAMPPLSPEEEARIQLSMRRDELLLALSAALIADDAAAIVTARQKLTEFDEARRP